LGSGGGDLYQHAAIGSANEELVLTSEARKIPTDWSADGRFIVYSIQDPKTRSDVWILPVSGDPTPFPFLRHEFNEGSARLSPDAGWMAYVSDESGQDEVYVERFPSTGDKVRISTQGGSRPQWRRDGKELFYVGADGKLTVVAVKIGATFEAAIPTELFPARIAGWTKQNDYAYTRNNYAVTNDGRRVLVNISRDSRPASITVVLSWTAALKQ
jgi:eukaryotic-like serine/threonine-protein kinase